MRTPVSVILYIMSVVLLSTWAVSEFQDWTNRYFFLRSGTIVTFAFLFCIIWETAASKVKGVGKWIWIIIYILVPFACYFSGQLHIHYQTFYTNIIGLVFLVGIIHFTIVRKKYAPKTREIDKITFDSI
ncbi:MAG: hypothetical protein K0Q79_775 [Flavipsychrobacter sp.]|jgi:hypothetical protein|nr:hypothetical protein [Flavipsychrobacter sp.]